MLPGALPEDDGDPQETREWLEALDALIAAEGPARATFVLKQLLQHARTRRVPLPQVLNTPYLNTISLGEQAPFPGNLEIEATSVGAGALECAGDGRACEPGEP